MRKGGSGDSPEARYHQMFSEHRQRGEWFAPHPDILAEIGRLTKSPNPSGRGSNAVEK